MMVVAERKWHVDKGIPVAAILMIVIQTFAVIYWAATTQARIDQLERKVEATAPQAERIIRLEEKIGSLQTAIAEIKALLTSPRPR